jgi:hypothetical protein
MKPKTIKELFGQIQIDADNQIIFNRSMYEKQANEIVDSLLKQQREICKDKALEIMDRPQYTGNSMAKAILNAPPPTGGVK